LLDINIVAQDRGLCSEKIIKYVRTITQDDLKKIGGFGLPTGRDYIRGCRWWDNEPQGNYPRLQGAKKRKPLACLEVQPQSP
jgi:hypothetical protein